MVCTRQVLEPCRPETDVHSRMPRAKHALSSHLLSPDVYGDDDNNDEAAGSNQRIMTAEELRWRKQQAASDKVKRQAAEAEASRLAAPQSKSQARKLAQIEARKQKEAARAGVLASLAKHQMGAGQLKLLGSSATLGQQHSKKQQLQRALEARNQGAQLEGLIPLEVPRRVVQSGLADGSESGSDNGVREAVAATGGAAVGGRSAKRGKQGTEGKQPPATSNKFEQHFPPMADEALDQHDDAWWAKRAMGFGMAVGGLGTGASRRWMRRLDKLRCVAAALPTCFPHLPPPVVLPCFPVTVSPRCPTSLPPYFRTAIFRL